MSLFSLEGNSFIVSVAFTLLMSGLIVYLMNIKISRLEKNLQNQNHVLTGIINGIQTDLENKNLQENVEQQNVMNSIGGRIPVSEDSEEESSSEGDDSSDDNEDVIKETTRTINLDDAGNVDDDNETKLININSDKEISSDSESESDEDSESESESDNDSESDNEADNNANEDPIVSTVNDSDDTVKNIKVDDVSEVNDVPIKNIEKKQTSDKTSSTININKLKVSELKNLVIEKELASPNSTQSMKKKELLDVLKNAKTETSVSDPSVSDPSVSEATSVTDPNNPDAILESLEVEEVLTSDTRENNGDGNKVNVEDVNSLEVNVEDLNVTQ